jgi:hypothetical protein
MIRILSLLMAAVAVFGAAADSAAQEVRGRITGAASGMPVAGAFVVLMDSMRATAAAGLTNERGQFSLRAPRPGTFTIRVERLALRAHTTTTIVLSEAAIETHDITVTETAVALPAVTAAAQRQGCRSFGDLDDETSAVWEEARKALAVAAWTAVRAPIRLHVVRSLRERRAGTQHVMVDVEDDVSREMRGSPWSSAPAAELVRLGFVRAHQGGYLYFGPDADVLLSDEFLATHCFRTSYHADSTALVGLEFRPRGTPSTTDIQGTLWLHRESAELRGLEYEYVRLPYRTRNERVGGSAQYRRLASGMWILSGWSLVAPRPLADENAPRGSSATLLMSEHSARVVRATLRDGTPLFTAADTPTTRPAAGRPADIPIPGGSMPARLWAAQRCGGAPTAGRMHVVGFVGDPDRRPVHALLRMVTSMPGYFEDRERLPDAQGYFWFCDAPAGQPYRIEAKARGFETVELKVTEPGEHDVAHHRFVLRAG